jgi:putative heme-binding domain-containing protein
VDPGVSAAVTAGVRDVFDRQPATLRNRVRLKAALDLPGLEAPGGVGTLTLRGGRAFRAGIGGGALREANASATPEGRGYEVTLEGRRGEGLPELTVEVTVDTPPAERWLNVTYHTDTKPIERPVPLEALLPTWAPRERQAVVKEAAPPALTQGGDWEAGRALFFGEAKCSTCHTVRGEGGRVGPNLSNLVHINPESVWQDIVEPSARINPDHVSYIIETRAGDTLSGLVRQEGDRVIVSEAADRVTTIDKGEVKEIRPSKVSLMPEGYRELGEKKLRDLVTFLTTERGKK